MLCLKIILKNPWRAFRVIIGKYFVVGYVEVPLTTICTLKCKNCSALMDYYTNGKHVELENNIKSLDNLIDSADLLLHLRLLGGEPLCYPNLYDVLLHFKDNKKVKRITIVTNGTLLFKDERILDILKDKKYDVFISNYGDASRQKEKLIKQLMDNNIKYHLEDENAVWRDFGDFNSRNRSKKELKEQYKNCKLICNSILNGNLHHCPRSSHGTNLKKIPLRNQDFINLLDENITKKQLRKELYDFFYGNVDYIEACNYCDNGTNIIKEIPAGIQCKK